ncbi:MAG: hypothetical protein RTU30_15210 [Candidatus Thorarchaeota archaeon]
MVRGIELDSEYSDLILRYLREVYGDVTYRVWTTPQGRAGVFVSQEYVFRTNSQQGIVVIFEEDNEFGECTVTCEAFAGATGLLGINLGSHKAAESTFEKRVQQFINRNKHPGDITDSIVLECHYCQFYDEIAT